MTNGKGDTPRPLSVPKTTFDANWAEIFPPAIDEMVGYDESGHYCPAEHELPKPKETLGNPEE